MVASHAPPEPADADEHYAKDPNSPPPPLAKVLDGDLTSALEESANGTRDALASLADSVEDSATSAQGALASLADAAEGSTAGLKDALLDPASAIRGARAASFAEAPL